MGQDNYKTPEEPDLQQRVSVAQATIKTLTHTSTTDGMRAVHQLLPEYMLDGENRSAFAKLVSARLYEPSDYAVPLSGHRKQILQILAWQDINEQYGTIADIIFRHRDHLVERALELIRPMNMTWATVREGSVIPLFCLSKPHY